MYRCNTTLLLDCSTFFYPAQRHLETQSSRLPSDQSVTVSPRKEKEFKRKRQKKIKNKKALTSLVSTIPLTYFPRTESTQKRLDSTAKQRSLSPTLTSIFLSPQLPLVCSPSSPKPVSARERARRSTARDGERGTRRAHAGPFGGCGPPPAVEAGCVDDEVCPCVRACLGGSGGVYRARALFRSCFDNATRPHIFKKLPSLIAIRFFIRGHTPLMKWR